MSSPSKQIIPILDLFRLLAALLVALVHYEIIFGQFLIYGSFASTALSWFFVLSGFILAYNYPTLEGRQAYRRYYLHRFIRIYPIYALAVILSVALIWIGYTVMGEGIFGSVRRPFELSYDLPEQKDHGFFLWAALRHLTFTQSIGGMETLKFLFNGPLWSLVLEVYFYLFFPLFLLLLRPINTLPRILIAFVVGYALQFMLILWFLPDTTDYNVMNLNVPVYTNPLIRGIEFVFGMLLYKAFILLPRPDPERRAVLWPVAVASLAYALANYIGETWIPYQFSMFFVALPFVVLQVFTLIRANWHPSEGLVRFCLWCGGMSYILYCFHWPIMEFVQLFDLLPETIPRPLHVVGLLTLFTVICHLLYRHYESPLRRWLYRKLDQPRVERGIALGHQHAGGR
ncbi:MAG: acyltransferase [Pseudohongiellaceae bacterium]